MTDVVADALGRLATGFELVFPAVDLKHHALASARRACDIDVPERLDLVEPL